MTDERPLTDVAVGLVFDRDGRVLLGQRPAGKPYAGWWEFPGGKLEAGESVAAALARELHEELGIRVGSSQPWIVREHSYPHARVRLHFRLVFDWAGEPTAREGQAFGWTRPDAIEREPLLPATVPILAMLALPRRVVGLAADRIADPDGRAARSRPRAGGGRPRVLFVLDVGARPGPAASPGGDRMAPPSDPGRLARVLRRVRAVPGSFVCAAGAWPADLLAECDGIVAVPDKLPMRVGSPGLLGLRIDDPDDLSAIGKVDADFAVVTADVSARTREFTQLLASTPMPVYLLGAGGRNRGLRPQGLQGKVSGCWPGP